MSKAVASVPDKAGRYGDFGGRYVPETLVAALDQLEASYADAMRDPAFRQTFEHYLKDFVGRPTPLH